MTVKECILAAAGELGMYEEVRTYLDGESIVAEADAENLLRCFNLVENELALDYLPLWTEEEVETDTGVVFFSQLSRSAVRIVKVTDKWGNEVPFRLFPEYVKAEMGNLKVRYTYTPETKGLDGECDFTLGVSVRLFAYGIAAEYCLASGAFEESAVWEKKYKEAIAAVYKNGSVGGRMVSRRWV